MDSLLSSNNSGIDNQSILEMSSPRSDDNTMVHIKLWRNFEDSLYKFGIIDTSFMKVNISNDIHIMGDETVSVLIINCYIYIIWRKEIYMMKIIYIYGVDITTH